MSRRNQPEKAPFDKKGNLMNNSKLDIYEWRPNKSFVRVLRFDHLLWRKNSPPLLIFRDDEGYTYPVFLNSIPTILGNSEMVMRNARIDGTWIVIKVGDRYGLEGI